MQPQYYSYIDLLAPIYVYIFYLKAQSIVAKNSSNSLYKKYFINGFWYKMIGSLGFYLIYAFYYKGGDSCAYFINGTIINEHLLFENFSEGINLLFSKAENYINFPGSVMYKSAYFYGSSYVLRDEKALMVAKISSLLSAPCFNSYLCTSLTFGFLSYIPTFKLFTLISNIYPDKIGRLSFAFLRVPSFVFWGSSVSKDTICVALLCVLIYTFYKVVVQLNFSFKYFIAFFLSAYFVAIIKSYILFAVLPGFLILTFITYQNKFFSGSIRYFITPFVILLAVASFGLLFQSLSNTFTEFSTENMETRAEGFKIDHTNIQAQSGGSGYSLGDFDYSPSGILQKTPLALAIALFGPFPWQIRNAVMFLSSMESTYFLYLFITTFFTGYGISRFRQMLADPIFLFCLSTVLILGVSIGITSFNYGALVRFKIPLLPFFATMIALMTKPLSQKA